MRQLFIAISALALTSGAASAQTNYDIDTVCSKGAANIFSDVQKYYFCTRENAIKLEPSGESADLVATASLSVCSVALLDLQMEATACDGNLGIERGVAVHYSQDSIKDVGEMARNDAIALVVRIRAFRHAESRNQ